MRRKKRPQVDPFAGYQGLRSGNVAPPWGSAPLSRTPDAGFPADTAQQGTAQAPQWRPGATAPSTDEPSPLQDPPPTVPPPVPRPADGADSGDSVQPTAGAKKGRKPKRKERREQLFGGAVQINTHRADLATRALRGSLWGVMALVVVCVLALVLNEGRAVPPPTTERAAPSGDGASGFAAVFMQRWLPAGQGTESELEPYMSSVPALTDEPKSRYASGTPVVLTARQARKDHWSVLVAVNEVARDEQGELRNAGVHWYRLSVAEAGTAGARSGDNDSLVWQVTGPPYEVPAPTAAETLTDSAYTATNVSLSGPVGATSLQFLNAYLVGDGELARYTSPGAGLVPVTPPSAAEVTLTSIAAVPAENDAQESDTVPPTGTTVRVLVQANVTGTSGVEVPMEYPLTLRSRAGRWEVASIDPAPATTGRTSAPDRKTPAATATDEPSGSASTTP